MEHQIEDEEVGFSVEFFNLFGEGTFFDKKILIWASKEASSCVLRVVLSLLMALLINS
jgi:hypothetical protein